MPQRAASRLGLSCDEVPEQADVGSGAEGAPGAREDDGTHGLGAAQHRERVR